MKGFKFSSTIAYFAKNENLKKSIKKWAEKNNVEVFEGEGQDIIAVPNFATIVDRNVLDHKVWEQFLSFVKAGNTEDSNLSDDEKVRCDSFLIIVDNINDWDYPEVDYLFKFNPEIEHLNEIVTDILDIAYKYSS